ncbi:glycosyltransferase family 9 protein [Marinibaculum pumilum]|uniref:Glycosyltransferase family 9 protein n=1 Tax=Marinibaculum pumilum TaxID=1766165 RepID=A0ABV7L7V5_9PROT
MSERILVIKLGALGDMVQAIGPFQAIRAHHLDAHLTLLTTAPFEGLARDLDIFDEIWLDRRPRWWQFGRIAALRNRLLAAGFRRVYDLQTSDRSGFYFRLWPPGGRPEWSGIAAGCSHPHANPDRDSMHTLDRQAEQLELAGIPHVPPPDLRPLRHDIRHFAVGPDAVLLVPGGAAHRPGKRWPAASYAKLARLLAADGLRPVVLGSVAEQKLAHEICADCPAALDLSGQTDLGDIVGLAQAARGAVGNDTGPMHLIAAAGCPSVVLFSAESDPSLCAPRGRKVTVLGRPALSSLEVAEVGMGLDAIKR